MNGTRPPVSPTRCARILACLTLLLAALSYHQAQAQTFSVLRPFQQDNGNSPYGTLIIDSAGNLYGTTYAGGSPGLPGCGFTGCGAVFKLDAAGTETVLYSFAGRASGNGPMGGVVCDSQGNLYGTTSGGGSAGCVSPLGCGLVFEIEADGNEKVLYTFENFLEGRDPQAGLVRDAAGNLYGTTTDGGFNHCGTVFKVDSDGAESLVHSFEAPGDGCVPVGALTLGTQGTLYGTTEIGGLRGCQLGTCGTVFRIDPSGHETILYSFTGGADGAGPESTLVVDAEGNLYGTTPYGGDLSCNAPNCCGVVFKVEPSGAETVLHTFKGGNADGWDPIAGVVRDSAGNLYGTTYRGGTYGYGTVYKLDAGGQESLLHIFGNGPDGGFPYAGLVSDSAGNLYGTDLSGGYNSLRSGADQVGGPPLPPKFLPCEGGCGVVYKIAP